MSCLLISERIMRDKIAQGVQEGGGPRATHGPTPQLLRGMAIESLPDNNPQGRGRRRKKEEEWGRITREDTKGKKRGIKSPAAPQLDERSQEEWHGISVQMW